MSVLLLDVFWLVFSSFQVRGLFAKDNLTWECDTAKHLQPSLPLSVNYPVVPSPFPRSKLLARWPWLVLLL